MGFKAREERMNACSDRVLEPQGASGYCPVSFLLSSDKDHGGIEI